MGKMKKEIVFTIILFIVVGVIIFHPQSKQVPNSRQEIVDDCQGLLLFETVECVNKHISSFYKFKENDDNIKIPFNQLRDEGGDCKDWSEFWSETLSDLGYMNKFNVMSNGVDFAHVNILTWNFNGEERTYCLIDEINFECWKIK